MPGSWAVRYDPSATRLRGRAAKAASAVAAAVAVVSGMAVEHLPSAQTPSPPAGPAAGGRGGKGGGVPAVVAAIVVVSRLAATHLRGGYSATRSRAVQRGLSASRPGLPRTARKETKAGVPAVVAVIVVATRTVATHSRASRFVDPGDQVAAARRRYEATPLLDTLPAALSDALTLTPAGLFVLAPEWLRLCANAMDIPVFRPSPAAPPKCVPEELWAGEEEGRRVADTSLPPCSRARLPEAAVLGAGWAVPPVGGVPEPRTGWEDVEWFATRGRFFLSVAALLFSWRRSGVPKPSDGEDGEGDVTTVATCVAAASSTLAVSTHPVLLTQRLLRIGRRTSGTTAWGVRPGGDGHLTPESLLNDLRRVGFLWGPYHRTETPAPGWRVTSRFDSGSLGPCHITAPGAVFEVEAVREPGPGANRMWFSWEMTRPNATIPQTSRIRMTNLPRNSNLYKPAHGLPHRPVVAVDVGPQAHRWRPVSGDLRHHAPSAGDDDETDATLEFEHTWRVGERSARFAFTYPYPHTEAMQSALRWAKLTMQEEVPSDLQVGPTDKPSKFLAGSSIPAAGPVLGAPGGALVAVRTLCLTPDGNEVPLVTVTGPGPHDGKLYCAISARVHAGEVPASFIVHGLVDALLRPDPIMQRLRQRFIFKVVPALNPDGVCRGFSRGDGRGVNLNRYYSQPDPLDHPAVHAVRGLLSGLAETGRMALYIDIHAHANKRGAFFYGNTQSKAANATAQSLYALLVQLRTPYFDLAACNFTERLMNSKDRSGLSKRGTGRVSIGTEYSLPLALTLEMNYSHGDSIQVKPNPLPGAELKSRLSRVSARHHHGPPSFRDVGKGLIVGLLDLYRADDTQRQSLPGFPGGLEAMRRWLADSCKPDESSASSTPASPFKPSTPIQPSTPAKMQPSTPAKPGSFSTPSKTMRRAKSPAVHGRPSSGTKPGAKKAGPAASAPGQKAGVSTPSRAKVEVSPPPPVTPPSSDACEQPLFSPISDSSGNMMKSPISTTPMTPTHRRSSAPSPPEREPFKATGPLGATEPYGGESPPPHEELEEESL
eukprot:Hpha_TRINITY_DN18619_c0_g1::TRINITY_DN18619_c0_g1_i1::g.115647::m.115647